MLLLETTKEYISAPVTGPLAAAELEACTVQVAVMPDGAGEPADADWKPGAWLNHEAALKYAKGDYPPGSYLLYLKVITADGDEAPVMLSGRLRIGDARS
jgi:hypothetical protein